MYRRSLHPIHIRMILDRLASDGIVKVKEELKVYVRGWYNYFAESIPTKWRNKADKLIRRRIRQLLWKQRKKSDNRRKQLMSIGTNISPLGEFAYSSNRYWRMAKTPLLHRVLSKKKLVKLGWYAA